MIASDLKGDSIKSIIKRLKQDAENDRDEKEFDKKALILGKYYMKLLGIHFLTII
jgi:hypothetical protein